jgi:hypothetical protein
MSVWKPILLLLAGFFVFLSSVMPPWWGLQQLVRANVGYVLAFVSAVCVFVECRRFALSAAAVGLPVAALSFFAQRDLWGVVLLFASQIYVLVWGWLGLLWAGWRLGGLLGVVVVFLAQLALSLLPAPPLRFANLLPDWALYAIGDNPETTYLNWARFFITYATTVATLHLTRLAGRHHRREAG